jgi:hypothetical protein
MSLSPEAPDRSGDYIDDIGLFVGIEQGCSISAAEAYKTAHDLIRAGSEQEMYIVDDDPVSARWGRAVDLHKMIRFNGRNTALSLVAPYRETSKEMFHRRFFRTFVDKSWKHEQTDPLLCARIGKDVYLPLARFALQTDNEYCSYVQMGSEMRDASVVMTPLDEQTSRLDTVEAIRALFAESDVKAETWSEFGHAAGSPILRALYERQIAKNEDLLLEAREAMLVRRCNERLVEDPVDRELTYFAEDGTTYTKSGPTKTIMRGCRIDDVRFAELVLVGDEESDNAAIVVVTRNELAFAVIQLIAVTGKIVYESLPDNLSVKEKTQTIQLLHDRLKNKPLFKLPSRTAAVQKLDRKRKERDQIEKLRELPRNQFGAVDISEQDYIFDPDVYGHTVPATYLYRVGLLHESEGAIDNPYNAGMTREGVDRTFADIERLLDNPESFQGRELPWGCDNPPVWLALSRLPQKRAAEQAFFDSMGVSKKIRERAGSTSLIEEQFVARVQQLSKKSEEHIATLEGINTGTNHASISIMAKIIQEGTIFTVGLYAKAAALKQQPFPSSPYREIRIDIAGSICKAVSDDRNEALSTLAKFLNTLDRITEAKAG